MNTSIIIPNYNGLRFLAPCLDALRGQTYPRELTEVILVDDGSTDDSVSFVRGRYPEVVIVQMARNSGLAAACNAGARAAHGDLLVMLNNDTEVEPGWLAALVESAAAHPAAGTIASKMLLFDRRDTLHNAGDLMGADGYIFATPENLAAISGMLKDFFDRTYYAVLERLNGRPYATLICAGSDGQNAARQIERIATGWRLKSVAPPLIVCTHAQSPEEILRPKQIGPEGLQSCREIGAAMAAGLVLGVF